jgi:hypothetical protein
MPALVARAVEVRYEEVEVTTLFELSEIVRNCPKLSEMSEMSEIVRNCTKLYDIVRHCSNCPNIVPSST